jgi:hypothetical protein
VGHRQRRRWPGEHTRCCLAAHGCGSTFCDLWRGRTLPDKAAALFHSLIKSHPFMDGTKRTAFAAAVYFLHERGYTLQRPFLKDEIIRFCVGLAEEGQRLAEGELVAAQTIRQIGEWFKGLVETPASEETWPPILSYRRCRSCQIVCKNSGSCSDTRSVSKKLKRKATATC